jgi:hypothetical protein
MASSNSSSPKPDLPYAVPAETEAARAAELREAQTKAEKLFDENGARGLIRSGITESVLNDDIYALAKGRRLLRGIADGMTAAELVDPEALETVGW